MTLRTIQAGEKGFDIGGNYPPPAEAKAKGYTFMFGYLDATTPAKCLSQSQAEDYIAAGIAVLLGYEDGRADPNKGRAKGLEHGVFSAQMAQARSYPVGAPLLGVVDTSPGTSLTQANQLRYLTGYFEQTTPAGYTRGAYAGTVVGSKIDISACGWLPAAAYSWSGAHSAAEAIQKATALGYNLVQLGQDTIAGRVVDVNHCIKPCIAWGIEREPEMQDVIFYTNKEPFLLGGTTYDPLVIKWIVGHVGRRHLEGPEYAAWGSPPGIPMTNAEILQVPEIVQPQGLHGLTFQSQTTVL